MRRDHQKPETIGAPLTHALFELTAEEGEDYPDEGTTVYWGWRLVNATYPLATGAQDLTYDLSERGDYLYADQGVFYEEGSIVIADQVANRWFIRGMIREPQED